MDSKENKLTFKQNIEGVGNIRYSHAPLFTEKVYQKMFLDSVEDRDAELTKQEVREKCFQVLGYLEEFQRVVNNPQANAAEESKVIQGMETEDDLLALLLDEGMQEVGMNIESGEDQTTEVSASPKTKADAQRIYITKQIREIFSYKQVREFFLENLREEAKKYEQARPKLKQVAKMEFAQNGALRKMIQLYLQSKRTHGKLVQSSADNIAKLEAMRKKAEEKEKSERQSANEQERGFLEVQKLLQFKHQINEKGFALTHTRKQLVAQISEHVLAGRKVFLVGSTGTGKTELALYVSDTVSGKHEMVSWHEGTTPRDLFGYRELWTDKDGNTVSGTKAGPVTKAVDTQTGGATVIHDEYTAGTTRSQIAAKAFMNAKKGQEIHIPGFNGDVFEVSENFAEIFTGNPKDEKTKSREDMDPAILRMLTGLKIDYMPASEMKDVILANLIEDNGVLKLSRAEVDMIKKLCNAAELMHMFHNREFTEISNSLGSTSHEFTTLKGIFGGNIEDARLDKHFLDPGTLFSMFSDFDFTRAKSGDLKKHLEERLSEFLNDPKTTVSEEKQLMRKTLELCGVLKDGNNVRVKLRKEQGQDYILPSQFETSDEKAEETDPLEENDKDDNTENTPESTSFEVIKEIMGSNFTGPAEWKQNLGVDIEGEIPPIPWGRETLLQSCPFESGKTVAETHALFLLPKEYIATQNINGTDQRIKKQLTVWEWQSLIKQAKGTHTDAKVYGDKDGWYKNEKFANKAADDMQWCLMPKNMLPNSTSKNYEEQENNPQHGLNHYSEYFTPSALQEVSKQFLHYLNTGKMLNSKYAWCSDTTSDGRRVRVGGFVSVGLRIRRNHPDYSYGRLGRAVARKF